jgi:MFS family permease
MNDSREAHLATVGVWRNIDFLKVWAGESVSWLGSEVTSFTIPLIAAVSLGVRPVGMGVLFLGYSASNLAIQLFAGAWVDRVRRRSILIATDLLSAAVVASIPVAAAVGRLTFSQLFGVFFIFGLVTPFFWSGFAAYVPALVEPDQLVDANAKLLASASGAAVVGPGIAGALVEVFSAPFALIADAASFVVSALFLGWVRASEPAPERRDTRRPILTEIRDGIGVTFGHPILRSITMISLIRIVGTLIWPNYVIFALRVLGLSPLTFGVVSSVGAVGFLAGSLFAPRLTRRFGIGSILFGASLFLVVSPFFMPFAPAGSLWAPILLTAAALVGATGDSVILVTLQSYVQAVTPRRVIGRVTATSSFIRGVGFLIGPLVGGVLGQTIGVRQTILVSACLHLLWPVFVWRSPLRLMRDIPALDRTEGAEVPPSAVTMSAAPPRLAEQSEATSGPPKVFSPSEGSEKHTLLPPNP